ncbi:MAG: DNA internalization-related competence protein ComEC/Rec2 [Pseudomonadota bacterium]
MLQLQQPALWPGWVYVLLAAAVAAIAAILMFRERTANTPSRRLLASLLLLAAAATGFGFTGLRAVNFQQTALNPALEGKDIAVTGQVLAMPQAGEDGIRFRFQVESARLDGQTVVLPQQIYLGWYAGFGQRMPKPAPPAPQDNDSTEPPEFAPGQRLPQNLRAGERWQMTVRLKAPHGNSNPHGFDYELWLWEQGVQATGYVRTGAKDVAPRKAGDSWVHPVERARQSVREAIFARIDSRQLAGVIAALVVGDQNAIERADWDVFRATGVAHLMSISGLHITMFAWVASLLLAWLWRRSAGFTPRLCLWVPAGSAGAWGGLLLAALYALFSGWGVPAQRTIWMLATVVLLRQSGRQWPWPLVWLLAMAVVVALDPWALMQAGFWLSFVAVGVLFATDSGGRHDRQQNDSSPKRALDARIFPLGRPEEKMAPSGGSAARVAASVGATLREQWVVTLALTPLSLLLFNQVSLVGLLANAVAIPWVTLLVTPLAMLGVFWSPVWDAAALCVSFLTVFLQWLSNWSWASISVAAAPLWFAIAGVIGGGLLAMRLPWHWRALGIPLLVPVLLWQPVRPAAGEFEIIGADVGQGNAVLVRTASHGLVYDTGPKFSRESDAGHRVLVPLLRALGERIDVLMLSHRDIDHIGGAQAVLAMQPQAQLVSSIEDGHELQAIRKSARCIAGQNWSWDGVDFEVLQPAAADYDSTTKSNAMSCLLRISNGRQSALLAGDIEAPQELKLVTDKAMQAKLKADFLLVPHHGSKTSSSAVFLDAVKPQFALAQAGYRNRFGHPVESVMQRYTERGVQVLKSPACGAATWRSDKPEAVLCQRNDRLRYWHHRP